MLGAQCTRTWPVDVHASALRLTTAAARHPVSRAYICAGVDEAAGDVLLAWTHKDAHLSADAAVPVENGARGRSGRVQGSGVFQLHCVPASRSVVVCLESGAVQLRGDAPLLPLLASLPASKPQSSGAARLVYSRLFPLGTVDASSRKGGKASAPLAVALLVQLLRHADGAYAVDVHRVAAPAARDGAVPAEESAGGGSLVSLASGVPLSAPSAEERVLCAAAQLGAHWCGLELSLFWSGGAWMNYKLAAAVRCVLCDVLCSSRVCLLAWMLKESLRMLERRERCVRVGTGSSGGCVDGEPIRCGRSSHNLRRGRACIHV